MIITELNGGLGNQLFQYAIGKQLAVQHHTQLLLDTAWLSGQAGATVFPFQAIDPVATIAPRQLVEPFATTANRWRRITRRIINTYWPHRITFIRERHPYRKVSFPAPASCYLTGYWQHSGYFTAISDWLRSSLQTLLRPYVPSAFHVDSQSVCLHIRRGDYVTNRRYHTLPAHYYASALQLLQARVGPVQVYVFSDDPDWCRQYLTLAEPVWFCPPAPALVHLAQMSSCSHFIIPNSTFSWWASWIGRKTNSYTIMPLHWQRRNGRLTEAPGLTRHSLTIPYR